MDDLLYKYRNLSNFRNFIDIILRNRLYATTYENLNDPMEGQYFFPNGIINTEIQNIVLEEKKQITICSLSRKKNHQLMWSHYSDGHRGVVLGVKIDRDKYTIKPIKYDGPITLRRLKYPYPTAIEILCHKLEVWKYEEEERVFMENSKYVKVTIEELIIGKAMKTNDVLFLKQLTKKINPNISIINASDFM